jgi:hypothetical protein
VSWYSTTDTLSFIFCHELWSKQERKYVHRKTQLSNYIVVPMNTFFFGSSTVIVADLVLMAVLSVINIGSVN